ncbi:MAG: cardiolipin synthase [Oscillospiraceae bacterium]|nr:cardiolipin synthase [Oscillospiraceae bacterium]
MSHLDEEAVLLLNKGKRGFFRLIFGRTTVVVLLLAVQFGLLFAGFYWLRDYTVYGGSMLLGLVVALVVVNRPRNPYIKITWILLIMLFPVFAIPFYFYVEAEWGHRLVRARLEEIGRETAGLLPVQEEARRALEAEDPGTAGLAAYLQRIGGFPVWRNSGADYYPLGEDAFAAILEELEPAREFIFMEYFIIREGYMWGRILNVLERKAKQGVEVRVLYDGTCALFDLPYHYPRQLERLGIRCRMCAPLRPLVSTHYNNRDHRKILVVDGRCAFTGGINLSDEYINRTHPHGHWKDVAVRITGEAVRSFTLMFLQMWNAADRGMEDCTRYLAASAPVRGEGWIAPYGDSPFDEENVGEMVYMDILNRARKYVHIMTPYLIIDHEMVTALLFAAKRGVDVKLIMPGVPDKKTVFALTRSYYKELIAGGVQIYEYTPGFVHAKTFVSDDATAVTGSINLDYRSLYLHFECAALLHRVPAVADIEADFQRTLGKCRQITWEDCRRDRLSRRVAGWILRPLAPLM